MGVLDFAKDVGSKIGVGESSKEKAAKAARAKAQAAVKSETAKAAAAKKKAEQASKARRAQAVRVAKAKQAAKTASEREAKLEAEKSAKLEKYLGDIGLKGRGLAVKFDNGVAKVTGRVADRATKEKIALALGNVEGVKQVNDQLRVLPQRKPAAKPATAAARRAAASRRKAKGAAQRTYTVKSGDSLSAIAKKFLGDANRYQEIFKANQPMLTDPNMIYPGQVLRIPKK